MKTKLLILCIFTLSSMISFSQENTVQKSLEEIQSKRIAFITERVNFTPEEAQAFWPLYNELRLKKAELNKKIRNKIEPNQNSNSTDYKKLNEEKIDAELKKALLEKEYYLKYKQILSEEKIYKLYKAEREFRKILLKEIQQKNTAK